MLLETKSMASPSLAGRVFDRVGEVVKKDASVVVEKSPAVSVVHFINLNRTTRPPSLITSDIRFTLHAGAELKA